MASKRERTLSYDVRDEIRRRIVRGLFRPGQPLREMDLEKQLGVSRAPVREALRLLIPTGLVEYEQWRGFRVKKYTPENIESLYKLRAVIEGMLIDDLERADLAALAASLKQHNEAMKTALSVKNVDAYFEENLQFHQDIIDASGNEPVVDVINNITEITLPARYALIMWVFPNKSALASHDQIVDRIAARDLKTVRALIEHHVLEDLDNVKQAYRNIIQSDQEQFTRKK